MGKPVRTARSGPRGTAGRVRRNSGETIFRGLRKRNWLRRPCCLFHSSEPPSDRHRADASFERRWPDSIPTLYFVAIICSGATPFSTHCSSAAAISCCGSPCAAAELPKLLGPGPPPQCCIPGTMNRRTNVWLLGAHLGHHALVVVDGVDRRDGRIAPAVVQDQLSAAFLGTRSGPDRSHSIAGRLVVDDLDVAVHVEGLEIPGSDRRKPCS